MSGNTFGDFFKVTTWGESHGALIGCTIDGIPSNIAISEEEIQFYLDKRKPGKKYTSKRNESDAIKIVSGVFNGLTTGAPLTIIIENQDIRSKDYSNLKDKFRPGHADFTYYHKYGIYDYLGGGRASARETAMRVAAGSIARKILLMKNISIFSEVIEIYGIKAENPFQGNQIIDDNFSSTDKKVVKKWEQIIEQVRKDGDSLGGKIKVIAKNVPIGLGEPVFDKIDADIAKAMFSIPAVKGVDIGCGKAHLLKGSEHNDQIYFDGNKIQFKSNHAGGILGGITTGQDIEVTVSFKPTSSILLEQDTITYDYKNTKLNVKGRHDPCVVLRAPIIVESMLALVLIDHYFKQSRNYLFKNEE